MLFCKKDFSLRPMQAGDLETVLKWRNLEHIRANMYTDQIITPEEHSKWFSDVLSRKDAEYYIFEYKEKAIGQSNVINIDHRNSKCHWGFYLGEYKIPRGSGAVMEYLTLAHIFEKKRIRKICCEVFSFNKSTVKLHRRFGFEEEGCLQKHILKKKKYENVIRMALFEEKWKVIKERMESKLFNE
ncbi:MAG: UDP-4-amino-4,6-dideoxy-N-acetyl-beta-L-altrosamine N-acetyltransferase [Candidatus Electrothrix sp. AR4]|nr:UDP-4-amino-4,6-dideoxy-N-acetyl-beta-L-altrosamine N-acetyltransferase [Candidatus Electrothrix sp. AR4]